MHDYLVVAFAITYFFAAAIAFSFLVTYLYVRMFPKMLGAFVNGMETLDDELDDLESARNPETN